MKKNLILLGLMGINFIYAENVLYKKITFSNSPNIEERITRYQFLNLLLSGQYNTIIKINDKKAKEILQQKMPYMVLKKTTIKNLLNKILSNDLFYSYDKKNNILNISYNKTVLFNLNFVNNITTSNTNLKTDNTNFQTQYLNNFWDKLQKDLTTLLKNVDENNFKPPIIDPISGIITVTGNKRQIETIQKYINNLKKRMSKEVLIDIKIYSVSLSKSNQTGINWSNFEINFNKTGNVNYNNVLGNSNVFTTGVLNLSGFINFLSKNGNVSAISNPKIVTLNGQNAIVNIGDVIYYKYQSGTTIDQNGNAIANYTIDNKFVGITLSVTPKIDFKRNEIILNLYPKITSFRDVNQLNNTNRDMPPDISQKSLNTVVKLKNNQTLILGGLITNDSSFNQNGVPILKEIPILGYAFKSKSEISNRKELVFVITPHIIDLNKNISFKKGFYSFSKKEKINKK